MLLVKNSRTIFKRCGSEGKVESQRKNRRKVRGHPWLFVLVWPSAGDGHRGRSHKIRQAYLNLAGELLHLASVRELVICYKRKHLKNATLTGYLMAGRGLSVV